MRIGRTAGGSRWSLRAVAAISMFLLLCAAPAGCGQPAGARDKELAVRPPVPSMVAREAAEQVADPIRIRIPAIGVDAAVTPLEVNRNGVLPPPATNEV